MSKITKEEIRAAIEALFDSGDWEMDVSEDVQRELDKRIPTLTKITTALHERATQAEKRLAAIEAKLGITAETAAPAPADRIAAIAAANDKAKAAKTALRVTFGAKKEVAA